MRVHVADHPLIAHKLTYLRDKRTDSPDLPAARRGAGDAARLRGHPRRARRAVRDRDPGRADDAASSCPTPSRSSCRSCAPGLGMLEGMVRLLPSAEVGFLGMQRNEETLEAITYANRLPDDLTRPPVSTSSTRCSPPAARWPTPSATSSTAAPTTSPRSPCSAAPEGIAHLEEALADARRPDHPGHRRDRRAAQRQGLHRPGPRRRRRPPLRRRLSLPRRRPRGAPASGSLRHARFGSIDVSGHI